MKAKVIANFKDKHTKALHKIGETIEITDKRFEEINSTAYGIFVEKLPVKKPATKK